MGPTFSKTSIMDLPTNQWPHTNLLPSRLPGSPESPTPPFPNLPPPLDPVPNIVHYVYGLANDNTEFPYHAYLAMRSALLILKPDRIMFHCPKEPKGYWWTRIRNWEGWADDQGNIKGMVEVVPCRDVQWVGKDCRPVYHYAHKADIIRLEVLLHFGGIYLDIDVYVLRSFSQARLMEYLAVMGMEAADHAIDDEMNHPGVLGNAVIIARPGAVFIKRWLGTYDAFNHKQWSYHSVILPWRLAKLYPTTITVLSNRAFFWPMWTKDQLGWVHESTEWDFEASGQLACHAWRSHTARTLEALDPVSVQEVDTSFTRMVRVFREPNEEGQWKAWLEGQGKE